MKISTNSKTRSALGLALTAQLIAPLSANAAPKPQKTQSGERPNVILIMTDQQRFDYIGAVNDQIISPNLDALCRDGVRFSHAYSSTPSSTPARAALLTGQSPWHHGLIGYSPRVAEQYPIELPRLLGDGGYYSYAIGKMHYYPQRALHGFVATELDESGRIESPGFQSDYRKWFAEQAAAMGKPELDPDATGIDWNGHAAAAYALPEELHPTTWTGERAVTFINKYHTERGDQPLFLKVSFARPHSPYDPPERYIDMYKGCTFDAPWIGDWAGSFAKKSNDPTAAFADFGAEYAQNSRLHYAASITMIDDQIGAIIKALKEQGLYDNTMIIFTSDHGDMMGDHHHWRKTYAYEGSSHVPFIVRPPSSLKGAARGAVRSELVEIRDILPTFLQAADIHVPAGVDGLSIMPLLLRKPTVTPAQWRAELDLEHSRCYGTDSGWVGLTDGRYKYVWHYERGDEQLFDLETDPHELHSINNDPEQSERMASFRAKMASHLAERGPKWVSPTGELLINKNVSVTTPNYPTKSK